MTKLTSEWTPAAAITLFALALRLLLLFSSPDRSWPHSIWYEGDAPLWAEYAAALDRGEAFEFNLPIHPPGVAYPLSWFYAGVREQGFVVFKVLWCVMSALACGLLFLCVNRTIGRRPAILASILCACSFEQFLLATSINSEAPYTFLLCAAVLVTPRSVGQARWWWAALLGVIHGLAMLLRPEHLLLIAGWCVWMLWLMTRPAIATPRLPRWRMAVQMMVMWAGVITVCLPYTIRANLAVRRFNDIAATLPDYDRASVPWTPEAKAAFDQLPAFARNSNFNYLNFLASQRRDASITPATIEAFFATEFGTTPKPLSSRVIVSNQGGMSFALANHLKSDGGFTRHALEHPKLAPNPTFNITFPPHLELLNDGYRIGWRSITSDFGGWVRLVGWKFDRFIGGVTQGFTAANLPIGREGVRHAVDMTAAQPGDATWWKAATLLLIVAGAAVAIARRTAGIWLIIIAYKIVVTILFYGYARQAASIGPAFFVLMALAIDALITAATHRWPRLAGWLPWVLVAVIMAAIAIDVRSAFTAKPPQVTGSVIQRPDLGDGAFTSFGRIELR